MVLSQLGKKMVWFMFLFGMRQGEKCKRAIILAGNIFYYTLVVEFSLFCQMIYNDYVQCIINIELLQSIMSTFGGKGDANTYTSEYRYQFSRNRERSEQTGESVRIPRPPKAASELSSKDLWVHYNPQTTTKIPVSAQDRDIAGKASGYGGVIQRCGNSEEDVKDEPKPASLDTKQARIWYLKHEAMIPALIDRSLTLEEQARRAFDLRNQFRTRARELMSDREKVRELNKNEPNLTWDELIRQKIDKGLSGDDIYKSIIESSQHSRKSVNQALGLE